jgi:hypothetical protein
MTKKNVKLLTAAAITLLGLAFFVGGMIIEPGNALFWLIVAVSVMGGLNWLVKRWQDRDKLNFQFRFFSMRRNVDDIPFGEAVESSCLSGSI